ncbi:MAG: hypothetical protein AAFZ52_17540 [Bacteroidota bacterium]
MNPPTKIDDGLSLRQALAQFRLLNRDYLSHTAADLSPAARSFFRSHDVAHVLFGCDISLFGEGSVKIWTIFGTTLGFWQHLVDYREANAYSLAQKFPVQDTVRQLFRLLISLPTLIVRAYRMRRRWPWSDFEDYLDVPIYQIRQEFNINVIPPPSGSPPQPQSSV